MTASDIGFILTGVALLALGAILILAGGPPPERPLGRQVRLGHLDDAAARAERSEGSSEEEAS